MLPEDFAVECLDGTEFRLSEHRGEVVVINLWATWCGPCVQELPEFAAFLSAHSRDVSVLAVHSEMVTEDVPAWRIHLPADLLPLAEEINASLEAGERT